VRKRAITTIAQFIPVSTPNMFAELLQTHVFSVLSSGNVEQQRTTVQLVAAVARNSAVHISPVLQDIVPGILKTVQRNDEELREGSLQVCS
jgi:cullin-associated NEDD8-dissociated protein 1